MSRYARAWRRVPGELGYLLPLLPLGILTSVLCWVGIGLGIGLTPIGVGIPILFGTMIFARASGSLELKRLKLAHYPPVSPPDWSSVRANGHIWRSMIRLLRRGKAWSYWAHGSTVGFLIGTVTWAISIAWTATALGGLSYWLWGAFLPRTEDPDWPRLLISLWTSEPIVADAGTSFAIDAVAFGVVGLVFLLTLPVVTHWLVSLNGAIARPMLRESRQAELQREITTSESSRIAAILAEDDALRRLERDIHDGPQQTLLRVQFDLASSIRALDGDGTSLRPLLDSALELTKDALHELRDLSRGMAPPLLQERGLESAVRSLAMRNSIPTSVTFDLAVNDSALDTIERSAYFIVSELLSNVAKHSGASTASVSIRTSKPVRSRSITLVIEVTDDGSGGATLHVGHGLSGLAARIEGLRGSIAIDSPAGGPTRILSVLPLRIDHGIHGTAGPREPVR